MSILPTKKQVPTINLSDKIILIHGEPKIGKSTLASQFPDALFIATEDGLRSIECAQIQVTGWMTGKDRGGVGFVEALQALRTEHHNYKTVVVDTVDLAWAYCDEYVGALHNEKTAAQVEYGKGYALLESEFRIAMADLAALKLGLVFISHSTPKEDTKTKQTRVVTTLHDRGRKYIEGAADIILYATIENGVRVVKTKPDPRYVAGDRTNRLPDTLDLSYTEIVKHFYENGSGESANKVLIDRIIEGEKYLAEHGIEYKRTDTLEEMNTLELEKLLRSLQKKAKDGNGNS